MSFLVCFSDGPVDDRIVDLYFISRLTELFMYVHHEIANSLRCPGEGQKQLQTKHLIVLC